MSSGKHKLTHTTSNPNLLLFHQYSANFSRHHIDYGGDVILEAVRKAIFARHSPLIHLRDMLSHAFYLGHTQYSFLHLIKLD